MGRGEVAWAATVAGPLTISCRGDLRSPRRAPAQAPQGRRETIPTGGGQRSATGNALKLPEVTDGIPTWRRDVPARQCLRKAPRRAKLQSNTTRTRGDDMSNEEKSIEVRLQEWLEKEGYPLEFCAAAAFRRAGFNVVRGWYVDGEPGGKRREIDLLAMDRAPGCQMGVDVVVECKWSGDKPWVVFSCEDPLPPALRTDLAIGTDMACSCLVAAATMGEITKLDVFSPLKRTVFGGRQAFTKGNDLFYEAITSTVSKTCAIADQFKQVEPEDLKSLLTNAMVVLPVIVIDARLFEVSCDSKTAEITSCEVSEARVAWQGSKEWPSCAFVDIVVAAHLDQYARQRFSDVREIIHCLTDMTSMFSLCLDRCSVKPLLEMGVEAERIPSFLKAAIAERQRSRRREDAP